jgi:hypothetical protein
MWTFKGRVLVGTRPKCRGPGFWCGATRCHGPGSVPTLTRNRTSGLEPLLTLSLPNVETDRHHSVNDCWPCLMVNHWARWHQLTISGVVTSFISWNIQDYRVPTLETNLVMIVWEAVAGPHLAYQLIKAAKTLFNDVCDHLPSRLPKIQAQISLSLCWRSLSKWGRDSVAFSFP